MLECHASMANRLRIVDEGRRLMNQLLDMPQPIVVALQGGAIGLGASGRAGVRRRRRVADRVPVRHACRDGPRCGRRRVPAVAAHGGLADRQALSPLRGSPVGRGRVRLGMVTDLVDTPEEALPVRTRFAERPAGLPPLAVQGTKRPSTACSRDDLRTSWTSRSRTRCGRWVQATCSRPSTRSRRARGPFHGRVELHAPVNGSRRLPRIRPLTPAAAAGLARELLEQSPVGPDGTPLAVFGVRGHPGLLQWWMPFGRELLVGGVLPARWRAAHPPDCPSVPVVVHPGGARSPGHRAGIDDVEIGRGAIGPAAPGWSMSTRHCSAPPTISTTRAESKRRRGSRSHASTTSRRSLRSSSSSATTRCWPST